MTNDARAQKRCGLRVIEGLRQRINEISRRDYAFGEPAVRGPAGKLRSLAKILAAGATEATFAARAVQPCDANALTEFQSIDARSNRRNLADNLMSRNDLTSPRG